MWLRTVAQIERLSVGGEPPAFAGIAYVAQFLERLRIVDVGRVVLPRELIDTVFYAGDSLAEFALRQADEYVGATCREVEPLNRGGAVLAGAFPQEAVVEIEPLRVARRQVRIARLDDVGILHGFDGSLCGRCRRCRTPPGAACGQSQQKNR